jgi:hypothetical protein
MPNKGYPGANEGTRHESGEKEPAGATSSDKSGAKSKGTVNGVGMGKADATGRSNGGHEKGEYNTGRTESTCYTHKKG